jgi:hypothetical protein
MFNTHAECSGCPVFRMRFFAAGVSSAPLLSVHRSDIMRQQSKTKQNASGRQESRRFPANLPQGFRDFMSS